MTQGHDASHAPQEGHHDGLGLYRMPDGTTYDGLWKGGRKHGVGVYKGPTAEHGADRGTSRVRACLTKLQYVTSILMPLG